MPVYSSSNKKIGLPSPGGFRSDFQLCGHFELVFVAAFLRVEINLNLNVRCLITFAKALLGGDVLKGHVLDELSQNLHAGVV